MVKAYIMMYKKMEKDFSVEYVDLQCQLFYCSFSFNCVSITYSIIIEMKFKSKKISYRLQNALVTTIYGCISNAFLMT